MTVIKSKVDEVIKAVNMAYNVPYYKELFLSELTTEDINDEPLNCKYNKWLIKKFSEEGLE